MGKKIRIKRDKMMIGVPILRYRTMAGTSDLKIEGKYQRY
jgi:hypothetical protein